MVMRLSFKLWNQKMWQMHCNLRLPDVAPVVMEGFLAISQLPIKILLIRIQRRRFHKRSNDLAIEQRLHTATLTSDTLP